MNCTKKYVFFKIVFIRKFVCNNTMINYKIPENQPFYLRTHFAKLHYTYK